MDPAAGENWTLELVLADHRLQYLELLKLDGSVEIQFVSLDEDDKFLGVPSSCSNLTWKVTQEGWVKVPKEMDPDAHRVLLSNKWWAGLKHCLNPSVRGLMRYDLFEAGFLRLFIVPVAGEECVRAIVTTNTPVVVRDLSKGRGNSHGAALLSECIIAKPPGEFPATIDDLFDGCQREHHQAEVGEDPELNSLLPRSEPLDPTSNVGGAATVSCGRDGPITVVPVCVRAAPITVDPVGVAATPITVDPVGVAVTPITVDPVDVAVTPITVVPAGVAVTPLTVDPVGVGSTVDPAPITADPLAGIGTTATSVESQQKNPLPARVQGSTHPCNSEDGLAVPLPLLVRQASATRSCAPKSHLFPHQERTVSWMLDLESGKSEPLLVPQSVLFGQSHAYHHGIWHSVGNGFKREIFARDVEYLCARSLARGGVVAHPVGSGKTVIAAEVIRRTLRRGVTAVYVPAHIARQWHSELVRFVPNIRVLVVDDCPHSGWRQGASADVVIIPHNVADTYVSETPPYRIVVDEPQEAAKTPSIFRALVANDCPRRWLLTATPTPLLPMMHLALGIDASASRCLPYDSMLFWFSRTRCRRDPPFLCLPVPPLMVHMHPVTLQWQEMSVLHSYTLQDDLQSAIRLASFFHLVHRERGGGGGGGSDLSGAQSFVSMDDWVRKHRDAIVEDLGETKRRLWRLEERVATERNTYVEDKERGVAKPMGCAEQSEDAVHLVADIDDFDNDVGVSLVLLQQRNSARKDINTLEKRLAFLQTVTDSITCEAECLICMNALGNRVVSVMPCLHSMCAVCASQLFQMNDRTLCPQCRASTSRRDVCTFVCSANNSGVMVWGGCPCVGV